MFAAVGGSKGAVNKRQEIETWLATVSSQNRSGLEAGHFKVPLTPKSTSFPDFISEKIISIDKILAFLQAFELVIG